MYFTLIASSGNVVVQNQDGSVSQYTAPQFGSQPIILTKATCEALNPTYTFDPNTQTCRWGPPPCGADEPIKLVLNSNGNDGSLFYVNTNDDCSLSIDFDYLFKIKCETLFDIMVSAYTQSPVNLQIQQQITNLQLQISQQTALCNGYSNKIASLNTQISGTPYTIVSNNPQPPNTNPSGNNGVPSSGFGLTPVPFSYGYFRVVPNSESITYSLTEPQGLEKWANILGAEAYQRFLTGDITSYSDANVQEIVSINETIVNNSIVSRTTPQPLILVVNNTVGSRTNLTYQLNTTISSRLTCQQILNQLIANLASLNAALSVNTISSCFSPVEALEMLDVSVAIDVVEPNGNLTTVYEFPLFPEIGLGNLYNYLIAHPTDSGFYVCDNSTPCVPLTLTNNVGRPIGGSCASIVNNILYDLFIESNLSGATNGQATFDSSIPVDSLASTWLHYSTVISDPFILSQISNKKIKLNLKINHTCSDVCILVDEIILNKLCTEVENTTMFVTESPGFNLGRVIDNKKSWLNNTSPVSREFLISNNSSNNKIRQTEYNVNDERLVINSKEIDLDISIASAIETDVWCYIVDNPCLLTGTTITPPCSGDCGDISIDLDSLMIQPLSGITTIEDFEYTISSELIDAKDRQTLSGYPTLRALYDRYLNSSAYCSTNSAAFNYISMDQFAGLVGNYWVDIIEQVIPATTIWGSVKIYSNTIFDQQKYKYRAYTSLLCGNPFSGQTILSPINGTSGTCTGVTVSSSPYTPAASNVRLIRPTITTCNTLCIAQMNAGSEFIGSVTITPTSSGGGGGGPGNLYAK